MKALKLNEDYVPTPGGEYMAEQYPGTGLYRTSTGSYTLVYLSAGLRCCVSVTDVPLIEVTEPNPKETRGSFSESFMLKALAIAQNPALAVQLDV
jgi:hypothetical protein